MVRRGAVIATTGDAFDLNPTEGAWAHLKRDLGNLVACRLQPFKVM
jgi:hypothetical protein